MSIWARCLIAGSVICASLNLAHGQSRAPDSWETDSPPTPFGSSCHAIEPDLIVPVAKAAQTEAMELLGRLSSFPLNTSDVSRFTDEQDGDGSAAARVAAAILRLQQEKERVLRTRIGSWGGASELRLIELERLQTSARLSSLRPFVVRGVAGFELTGGFNASWCGDDLSVLHISLGASRPSATRVPVVIYLEKRPARVLVGFSVAR